MEINNSELAELIEDKPSICWCEYTNRAIHIEWDDYLDLFRISLEHLTEQTFRITFSDHDDFRVGQTINVDEILNIVLQ